MIIRLLTKSALALFSYILIITLSLPTWAADSSPKTLNVRGHIYMITGQGGNIGVSSGEDGLFLIDDQYAPATPSILRSLKKLHPNKPRYVINTHWHGDHTGGNENFAREGSVVVAHKNVRTRMSQEQLIKLFRRKVPASPEAALPIITFTQSLSLFLNGEEAEVVHMPHAHTDGDAIVFFKKSNVVHMGDIYFAGTFPFIDTSSGGHIDGMISAVSIVLQRSNPQTLIIPGHGKLSDTKTLEDYLNMLKAARQAVANSMTQNQTLEQVQQQRPLDLPILPFQLFEIRLPSCW